MMNGLDDFRLSDVWLETAHFQSREAFRVTMSSDSYQDILTERLTDRPFLAWLPVDFGNGTIEVDLASVLADDAPDYARGFIGVAFRIGDGPAFEGLYLRPVNSTADDQVRRNHSTQYFSYPAYDFARLRAESPERYESYVDIRLDHWIHVKIVVHDTEARLYVAGAEQPALVVLDLKLGSAQRGGVGFWIESGTVGYFHDLRVTREG
jgi:hypothetical protein